MEITTITSENFPALYAAYAWRLRHYFYRRGIPVSDIDDCCQDAWLTAWNYRSKFNQEKGNIRGYIFMQARAALSWYFRKMNTEVHFLGHKIGVLEDYSFDDDGRLITTAHIPTDQNSGWAWAISGKVPRHEKSDRKRKLVCRLGHEQTPANEYITPSGDRQCRHCKRINARKRRDTKRAEQFESRHEW
jgi:DNA-directed RNA polymerase specialized sigma24 family protein